ncbi:MAG: hypothetical protein QOI76_980 [Frankiales bacterium]|nr:hypothetical protein [Frankiales bacterium]
MVEAQVVQSPHRGCEMGSTVEAVRAEALFASTLQPSQAPAPEHVRRAVATTMRRLGVNGCAAQVAREFGDHPDTAPARMNWALATIRTVYPRRQRRGLPGDRWLLRANRLATAVHK